MFICYSLFLSVVNPTDGESSEPELTENKDLKVPNHGDNKTETSAKDSSNGSSPTDLASKGKGSNILDKAVGILKKKASVLTEKELNPEFFQRLETRGSGDLPVEVVVPRRCLNSANVQNDGESEPNDTDSRGRPKGNCQPDDRSSNVMSRFTEKGTAGVFSRQRDLDEFARDKWAEERGNGKDSRTNWLAIQRQLLQLERQQAHLMNMLQVCYLFLFFTEKMCPTSTFQYSFSYIAGFHGWVSR